MRKSIFVMVVALAAAICLVACSKESAPTKPAPEEGVGMPEGAGTMPMEGTATKTMEEMEGTEKMGEETGEMMEEGAEKMGEETGEKMEESAEKMKEETAGTMEKGAEKMGEASKAVKEKAEHMEGSETKPVEEPEPEQ